MAVAKSATGAGHTGAAEKEKIVQTLTLNRDHKSYSSYRLPGVKGTVAVSNVLFPGGVPPATIQVAGIILAEDAQPREAVDREAERAAKAEERASKAQAKAEARAAKAAEAASKARAKAEEALAKALARAAAKAVPSTITVETAVE